MRYLANPQGSKISLHGGGVAELPFRAPAVILDVEFGREAEVALAARGEADVPAMRGRLNAAIQRLGS